MEDDRHTQLGIGVTPPAEPESATVLPPDPTSKPAPATDPQARDLNAHRHQPTDELETLTGRFIWISLRRAFRLQIKTNEVLASERMTLAEDAKHIVDPEQQAFLAWRRSVLLLVAIGFVPLTIIRFIESFEMPMPAFARVVVLLPAIFEGLFCAIAFDQLKNWTRWEKQRRVLFVAWALFMFAPFAVYLYPFSGIFDSVYVAKKLPEIQALQLRLNRSSVHMLVGLAFGVKATLVLGPKVISLMPGLIRAAIVSKLLFPGMTAPGWLLIMAAPLYALFAYIIFLLPYQITGSGYFVAGNLTLVVAQLFIAWSGHILTSPMDADEARRRIHRSWMAYIALMLLAGGFIVYGLHDFVMQLHIGRLRIVTGVLSFFTNVLLLTLIGTDGIVSAMSYFRRKGNPDPREEELLRYSEDKLDRFSA